MINFVSKSSFILSQKRHFFAKCFGENISKIITSVPGSVAAWSSGIRCHATEETGTMDREIESRQGMHTVVGFLKKRRF
jgi:hypothetical protein